jgi:hypothetical protein
MEKTLIVNKLYKTYNRVLPHAIYRRFKSGNAEYTPTNLQIQPTLPCKTARPLPSPQLERLDNNTAARDFSSRSYYHLSLVSCVGIASIMWSV